MQGGPFSPQEADVFRRLLGATDAVTLRRWDDAAKVPGQVVAGIEHYRPCLLALLEQKAS